MDGADSIEVFSTLCAAVLLAYLLVFRGPGFVASVVYVVVYVVLASVCGLVVSRYLVRAGVRGVSDLDAVQWLWARAAPLARDVAARVTAWT